MSTTKSKIPSWFNGTIYKKGNIVKNRFSGEECDFVMGASQMAEMGIFNSPHHIDQLHKGLDWFKKHNPEAYMILLD